MQTLLSLVSIAGAAYLALVLLVYVFQASLLYLPAVGGRALAATPSDIGIDFEDVRFTAPDDVSLHGWYVPTAGAEHVLLFCHGNAGNISHRLESIRIFHDLGLSVFIFDYRGYGSSGGQPSEEGTYLDAEAAWNYLTSRRGLSPSQIVVYGHSLGGAIAAHVAQGKRPAALILESAFSSIADVAGIHYWFLPVRWLSRFKYATADYVRNVDAPVLVVHSAEDEINPVQLGRKIFERANQPKVFLEIHGDHNAGFLLSGTRYTQGLRQFLREHAGLR